MYHDLYELVEKQESFFCIRLTNKEHIVFQSHFPDNPMLPGFIFFEIIAAVLKHEIVSIVKAKFLQIVKPCEVLDFYYSIENKEVRVKIVREKNIIAKLHYEYR